MSPEPSQSATRSGRQVAKVVALSRQQNEFWKVGEMEQRAFLAITAMLNAFPQSAAANSEVLLRTFEAVLVDVSDQAIIEAAQRFTAGLVPDQSKTFGPSIAEFATEARRIEELIPYRNRPRLAGPQHSSAFRYDDRKTRIRMGFKMSVLSAGIALRKVDDVAKANKAGLDELMALAQQWGVPIPEELWPQRMPVRSAAE